MLLAAVVLAAWWLAVPSPGAARPFQGTTTPSPTETATPAQPTREPPPVARLTVQGEAQEAGVGTYCWGGLCVDTWDGWVAPRQPMKVRSPFLGTLQIEGEPVPTGLALGLHRFDSAVGRSVADDPLAFWPAELSRRVGPVYRLPLANTQQVQLARAPGLYVISFSAYWKDVGDASYGFLVEVQP